jgi:hypothetical protein
MPGPAGLDDRQGHREVRRRARRGTRRDDAHCSAGGGLEGRDGGADRRPWWWRERCVQPPPLPFAQWGIRRGVRHRRPCSSCPWRPRPASSWSGPRAGTAAAACRSRLPRAHRCTTKLAAWPGKRRGAWPTADPKERRRGYAALDPSGRVRVACIGTEHSQEFRTVPPTRTLRCLAAVHWRVSVVEVGRFIRIVRRSHWGRRSCFRARFRPPVDVASRHRRSFALGHRRRCVEAPPAEVERGGWRLRPYLAAAVLGIIVLAGRGMLRRLRRPPPAPSLTRRCAAAEPADG